MSDNHEEEGEVTNNSTPKILTYKELLARKNQQLAGARPNRGSANGMELRSKRPAHNASGHKHRTHKPQGG